MKNDDTYEMEACTRYLAVVKPTRADADGLLSCLGEALSRIGIKDIRSPDSVISVDEMPVLIGAGTDGASVNIGAHSGMKGKLQADLPWLFWSWCFAHRLELACKDGFTNPLFLVINEMLLILKIKGLQLIRYPLIDGTNFLTSIIHYFLLSLLFFMKNWYCLNKWEGDRSNYPMV